MWKTTDYQGYEVSDEGEVRSVDREVWSASGYYRNLKGKLIRPRVDKRGYFIVNLHVNGVHHNVFVHQLVARAFIENPRGLLIVNHKDLNKQNNHHDNLEWVTQQENIEHACDNGAMQCVLKPADIPIIRKRIANGETDTAIGKDYGVNHGTIFHIRSGRNWSHVS